MQFLSYKIKTNGGNLTVENCTAAGSYDVGYLWEGSEDGMAEGSVSSEAKDVWGRFYFQS